MEAHPKAKCRSRASHYSAVIMNAMSYQITSVSSIYSTVCSGVDESKHQSFALLALLWEEFTDDQWIPRWPVNSPHKEQVTRKMLPFDEFIMITYVIASVIPIMVSGEVSWFQGLTIKFQSEKELSIWWWHSSPGAFMVQGEVNSSILPLWKKGIHIHVLMHFEISSTLTIF